MVMALIMEISPEKLCFYHIKYAFSFLKWKNYKRNDCYLIMFEFDRI